MPEVSCRISLDYLRDPETGEPFPGLWMVVGHPDTHRELEVQCHLDSGAEVSLFDPAKSRMASGWGFSAATCKCLARAPAPSWRRDCIAFVSGTKTWVNLSCALDSANSNRAQFAGSRFL